MSTATIETPRGTITIELTDTETPNTVANFVKIGRRRLL